ncbi:hypothetical protein CPC08DRAFT_707058 [Agrocybe pediades]|nr:hypothetical protein CPC08DRAFT_707058 [Agrocybe pediades]
MSTSAAAATTSTRLDGTPKNDRRMLAVVVVLGIVGAFLIAFIIWLTLRVKRRESSGENLGPYQGTLIQDAHPAADITPFGAVGHVSSAKGPRYKHKPGEDMRIAVRRPDGAWHFTDSRTPFTPTGVKEIDVTPSPISSCTSLVSFNSRFPPSNTSHADGFRSNPNFTIAPPPPAFPREPCREHFDDRHSPM